MDRERERRIIERIQQAIGSRELPDESLACELDELFSEHSQTITNLCRRLVPDRQRADEIAQETFFVAYRKLPEFQGNSSISAWLVSIAARLCQRARDPRSDPLREDGILDGTDPKLLVLEEFSLAERAEIVQRAALALGPVEQEFVQLRYIHGLSQVQIHGILKLDRAGDARALQIEVKRNLKAALLDVLAVLKHGSSLRSDP